jgi:hypothetical protein
MTQPASERLRELDGATRYDAPTDRLTFVAGRDAEHTLLRVLPLIADVVEAAEQAPKSADLHKPLIRALTALREALEKKGVKQ